MLGPSRTPRRRAARLFLLALSAAVVGAAPGASAATPSLERCTTPRGTVGAQPAYASTHPHVLLDNAPTLSCLQSLLSQGAPSATRFKGWVDGELDHVGEPGYVIGEPQEYGFEAWHPALLARVTGEQRYADYAVAYADHMVATEEAAIARGETPEVAGDSYLYVGEIVGSIALVYDWCFERTTPAQRARWIAFMNQAVGNVWNPSGATWGGTAAPWSGWSIDNPSNNYYYSFLRATMLLGLATHGENAQADAWLAKFRTAKIGGELVPTFTHDLIGGGSREGTGYGIAMKSLFELYDWWERSTGERIADLTDHAARSLQWMTSAITPTLDRIVAVGDQARDSGAWLYDYHREYLLALMSLYSGTRAAAVADRLLAASSEQRMGSSFEYVWDYLYEPAAQPSVGLDDYSRTSYGAGSGLLTTRSAWNDPAATFASLVCGPYTESHAHMEQGSFQLFRGEWLAPTGNRYSHSGLTGGPDMKNLVRFVGSDGTTVPQHDAEAACSLHALKDAGDYVYASVDTKGAYGGESSVVQSQREFLFIRPSTLVVFDRVRSTAGTSRVWTLNLQGTPTVSGNHLTYLGDEHGTDRLDVDRVAPAGLSYSVSHMDFAAYGGDTPLDPADPSRRVDAVDSAGTQTRFLHVLGASADGTPATSNVVADDVAGMTGTTFTLADGRAATVRFANDAPGGTIELRSPGGAVLSSGALPSTVSVPPPFSSADVPPTAGPSAGPGTTPAATTPTPAPTSSPGTTPAATAAPTSAPAATTGAAGHSVTQTDPWTLGPRRTGKRLTAIGVQVMRSGRRCPARGRLTVRSTRGRLLGSVTVRLAADGQRCVVTTGTVRLRSARGVVRALIGGNGLRSRAWRLPGT